MARSPLIHSFRTAYRTLVQARAAGRAPLDYAEQQVAEALERRAFLRGSAALLGGTWAAGCARPRPPSIHAEEAAVVIVGGGLAGLHCAYRLRQAGVEATVYEASSRLGGRIFSDRTSFPEGQHAELGGEQIDTSHETMHALARELSIELYDYHQDARPGLSELTVYVDGRRLGPAEFLEGFAPIAAQMERALASLHDPTQMVGYRTPNGAEALDALSIRAWLDSIGARGPVRTLLEIAHVIESGLEADVASALTMIYLVTSEPSRPAIFGDSDGRFHPRQGNDAFITALSERLSDSQLRREHRLVALSEEGDGRYRLTFQRGGTTREVKAHHVVLALPFSMLRQVDLKVALPPAKRRAIAELAYGTNSKLIGGFTSRVWRDQGSDGTVYSDTGFQCGWDTSRMQPGRSGIFTNFTGGLPGVALGNGTPQGQLERFLSEFERVFPGSQAAANGKVVRMHWPSHPLTLGSYAGYKAGQYTAFSGAEGERVGNLHFCGEHTSLEAQGFMEGAAATGGLVAREVAAVLRRPLQAAVGSSGSSPGR